MGVKKPKKNTLKNPKKKTKKPKTKKPKTKTFKKLRCSPSKNPEFTCYSNNSLEKLKQLWNIRHPDSKIITNNSYEIWSMLKQYMQHICSNEKCWLNQKFMHNNVNLELKNNTFAPKSPESWKKNPNQWLSSVDIDRVMQQYEKNYPVFTFIGPSPIDFDKKKLFGQCVWNELCDFDLKQHIKKGHNKIGIVFNTDPHYLEGSHWICMFININKNFIYYFDSNADNTPKQINIFAKRIIDQGNLLGYKLNYYKNKIVHQKSNTECGMYVLYIIIQLLKTNSTPQIFDKRIPDKYMKKLRKILFN